MDELRKFKLRSSRFSYQCLFVRIGHRRESSGQKNHLSFGLTEPILPRSPELSVLRYLALFSLRKRSFGIKFTPQSVLS